MPPRTNHPHMTLTLQAWDHRYRLQARWTDSIRSHILARAGIRRARAVLEVGCGTGAVSSSVGSGNPSAQVVGLDIDEARLHFARAQDRVCRYAGGDALRLPFRDETFDLSFCHYLLLWIPAPQDALREMARVTRRGGWVAALAEPDYGARIDYPPPLEAIGRRQTESLRRQGADPECGRKLAGLLAESGVRVKECGVLGAQGCAGEGNGEEADSERNMLLEDLGDELAETDRNAFIAADRAARRTGRRVLFLPTFFAAGTRE
jgi:SAM-dependent methyltransferase